VNATLLYMYMGGTFAVSILVIRARSLISAKPNYKSRQVCCT
jgi:hypothetical protein